MRTFNIEVIGFSGFYDSWLSDRLYEDMKTYKDEVLSKIGISKITCDLDEYEQDVSSSIASTFLNEAHYLLSNNNVCTFNIKEGFKLVQPNEYNFKRDKLITYIDMEETQYNNLICFLKKNKEKVRTLLKEFSSKYARFSYGACNDVEKWSVPFENVDNYDMSCLIFLALAVILWEYNGEYTGLAGYAEWLIDMEVSAIEGIVSTDYIVVDTLFKDITDFIKANNVELNDNVKDDIENKRIFNIVDWNYSNNKLWR